MLEDNQKKKRKMPILIIGLGILLLIGGIGSIFFYGNKEKFKLSIEDSKIYPKFKESIDEYTLYTNKNEVKVICPAQVKSSGCNKVIKLKDDETDYIVKSKDK
ncbi:MAG: hypothetical protein IK997_05910, partial [Bacilli bacterium]|nr:hypothetical protein [Bacilli bacterium]